MSDITPFKINVPQELLDDLHERLVRARLPEQAISLQKGEERSYGVDSATIRSVVEYWRDEYDWRKVEAELNSKLPQFTTTITSEKLGPLKVHFVHKQSSNPKAIPLIIVHGWPGNFAEVSKVLDELTEPSDPRHPSFHVISPSIPGYAFSEAPKIPGLTGMETAKIFNELMKRLGYTHYMAQGGDWGGLVVRSLAAYHHENCRAILNTMLVVDQWLHLRHPIILGKLLLGKFGLPGGYSKLEMDAFESHNSWRFGWNEENGYQHEQSTKPDTLGFALNDSPVGLLAWLVEKFQTWTDNYPWTPEELITWTMFYWIPGPTSTLRYYKENDRKNFGDVLTKWSPSLLAVLANDRDLYTLPNDFGTMIHPLRMFKRRNVGGHFMIWERPEDLTSDLREFAEIVCKEDRYIGK